LLNPTTNVDQLSREYDMIDYCMGMGAEVVDQIRLNMGGIRDLDKIGRQLIIRKIYPSSIYALYQSIRLIGSISAKLSAEYPLINGDDSGVHSRGCEMADFIEKSLNIEACKQMSKIREMDENIISMGISPELDAAVFNYELNSRDLLDIQRCLNKFMVENEGSETEYIKVHQTDKSGISLQMTKTRGSKMRRHLSKFPNKQFEVNSRITIHSRDIGLRTTGSSEEIDIIQLREVTKNIAKYCDQMNDRVEKEYGVFLEKLETQYVDVLEKTSEYIAKLDVLLTKTFIARKYNYCRPRINAVADQSFVRAHELRHCLIEHIQQNEIYVPNDVTLGENPRGILLYGTNAVGKTSLIRALGISVIMAQAGMFVPCTDFEYKPYTAIFSRILSNDDLFKGLSTFAVEMSELRIILKMSDKNSLILGDELCSGTETESALSLFMAGLIDLHAKGASFIFATHFHEITRYDEMRELTHIRVAHMSVTYNRERECLVYDRVMRDGQGNKMYGLEVCKSLYLPDTFLEKAYEIRNKYHPEPAPASLAHPKTAYNTKKVRGICENCGDTLGTEIHHIQHQADADENGYIGTFHKDHPANLMSVCEDCHHAFHGSIQTKGSTTGKKKKTTKGYAII